MRYIQLGNTKEKISVLGQGTQGYNRPYDPNDYALQKVGLKTGIESGMNFIDTAERYGWGNAEKMVGEVIHEYPGSRDDLFIATKVWSTHLKPEEMHKAVDRSLKNLGIRTIDLYQIHWPNPLQPLSRTMRTMEELVKLGKIRYIGVSNFSAFYFKWAQHTMKREEIVSNQVYYSLAETKPLKSLVPFLQKENRTLIACSPLGATRAHRLQDLNPQLKEQIQKIAQSRQITFQQVALAWLISHPNVQAIPRSFNTEHIQANARMGDVQLSDTEISSIEHAL